VLPFKNLSDSRENEYFSDGVTAEVIAQVSKIGRLKVISTTSVMHYKNSDKRLRDIGRELNVATVLEGTVRRIGDHVRVVAQLIDVDSEQHLWSETYDKDLAQIFAIQADVARNIADAMRTTVAPAEEERLRDDGTDDLEAYDLYLRGRHLLNKRTPQAFRASILCFDDALRKDTSYAAAYSGLADAYLLLGNFNVLPPQEAYPMARDAALKALQINESLGEAHTTLAFAKMYFEWDWGNADKEFRRALELNPSSARAHAWYSIYLTLMGETADALRESNLALSLDPLSVVTRADAGLTFYFTRKYDYAIEQYEKTLQMDPSFAVAYLPLGGAYEQKHMYAKAIELFSQASMYSAGHPIAVAGLGHCYALSGKPDDARSMLEVLLQGFRETEDRTYWVGPYWIAVVYAGLDDKENAMEWLERAYDQRDGSLVFMNVDPSLESLHGSARFQALVRRMSFATRQL
jgi:TolB-like protein/Tfp pilus assembly protein PilF